MDTKLLICDYKMNILVYNQTSYGIKATEIEIEKRFPEYKR